MGKKTVMRETGEHALQEQEVVTSNIQKAGVAASHGPSKHLEKARVYDNASYNNTLICVTNEKGDMVAWSSSGSLGFKGPKKATPYAATSVVDTLLQKLKKVTLGKVVVFVRGIGGGREAAVRALINQGVDIAAIQDVTSIPHNGPRPVKPRRV